MQYRVETISTIEVLNEKSPIFSEYVHVMYEYVNHSKVADMLIQGCNKHKDDYAHICVWFRQSRFAKWHKMHSMVIIKDKKIEG